PGFGHQGAVRPAAFRPGHRPDPHHGGTLMSIVRTYRRSEAGGQPRLEYREAWFTPGSGEVVVHHGRVGTTGTTSAEKVADDAAGEELLAGFARQCAEDGFAELPAEQLERLEVAYRLKGAEPTQVERGLAV